jgi:hypothetical protein
MGVFTEPDGENTRQGRFWIVIPEDRNALKSSIGDVDTGAAPPLPPNEPTRGLHEDMKTRTAKEGDTAGLTLFLGVACQGNGLS